MRKRDKTWEKTNLEKDGRKKEERQEQVKNSYKNFDERDTNFKKAIKTFFFPKI